MHPVIGVEGRQRGEFDGIALEILQTSVGS